MKKVLLLLVFGLMFTISNSQEPVVISVDTDIGLTIEQNHSPVLAIVTFKTVDLEAWKPSIFYKEKAQVANEAEVEDIERILKTVHKTPNIIYTANIPIVDSETYNPALYQNTAANVIYVTKIKPIIGFSNPVRKIAQNYYYPEYY